jgi:hypothetical protein
MWKPPGSCPGQALSVIPAKAGIQSIQASLDPGFRRGSHQGLAGTGYRAAAASLEQLRHEQVSALHFGRHPPHFLLGHDHREP